MISQGGFWSYRHNDDDADGGRISDLARDIVAQYEMLTGDSIELFLDRDSLVWGNAWQEKVDGTLANVAFFVPVITPRYFDSKECRRELRAFAARAEALGLTKLILPLHYVDFPALHEDEPSDDLIALVKRYQWAYWTELRFADRTSADYRKAVSELAQRLVDANAEVTAAVVAAPVLSVDVDEEPGFMDSMAEAEATFPLWTETIEQMGEIVVALGESMNSGAEAIAVADRGNKGFAGRLTVARSLAQELSEPADRMIECGNLFATQLSVVDAGVRAIIELYAASDDEEDKAAVDDFLATLITLAENTNDAVANMNQMIDQFAPIEKMSRDLRKPLSRLRQGLTVMGEAGEMTQEWVRLAREAGYKGE